jgi:hypothetical protein
LELVGGHADNPQGLRVVPSILGGYIFNSLAKIHTFFKLVHFMPNLSTKGWVWSQGVNGLGSGQKSFPKHCCSELGRTIRWEWKDEIHCINKRKKRKEERERDKEEKCEAYLGRTIRWE